jgi:D,D-heptose 1,7-bisphosphate phosphatase
MAEALRRAAFVDRDGVINEDRHYVHRIEDFHFLPGAVDALRRLQHAGHALVVVTNQGGVGLGLYSEEDVALLHAYMRRELASAGVRLDGVYHCPHHPRSTHPVWRVPCNCRKPAPGMLQRAAHELGLDLGASLLVGDKGSDLEAARAAGVPRRYLVRSGHATSRDAEAAADAVFDDLQACVDHLLGSA